MAQITNRIAPAKKQNQNQIAKFMANGMEVQLSPNVVRDYMVSGNKDAVTIQEIAMFINLCKYTGLNPWLREAYCIKYGSEPATLVVGKEAYFKRAESNESYDGMASGIIVHDNVTGESEYRNGTLKLPNEEIIGGWAEVFRKDRSHSTRIEVSFDEYTGRKKDGSLNGQWQKKPATMIRKVAQVQALREAFPATMGSLMTAEEQGVEEPENLAPIDQEVVEAEMKEVPPAPNPADALFGEQEEF